MDLAELKAKKLHLLDSQIELILNSLQFYVHTYRYVLRPRKKPQNEEINLDLSFIIDTYEQIAKEYTSYEDYNFGIFENSVKKVA